MSRKSLRFGITDGAGLRAATWKLWTQSTDGKFDVYLSCRPLGGSLKASLHQSGQWYVAYSRRTFEEKVKDALPRFRNRFIETWPRPSEIAPGITIAFRIITPSSAVKTPLHPSEQSKIIWIPNAPESRAREVDVFLISPDVPVTGWPGKRSMNTSLVGAIPLQNRETVWVVFREIEMPDLTAATKGIGRFYTGASVKDLDSQNLRALVFGSEPDGSRVMYDCAVEGKTANNAMHATCEDARA